MVEPPSIPQFGGTIDMHHHGSGIARCCRCGWVGIPTFLNGTVAGWVDGPEGPVRAPSCPACEAPYEEGNITREQYERELLGMFRGLARGSLRLVADKPKSKISRNAPCPCGSGVKAKKCACGALQHG